MPPGNRNAFNPNPVNAMGVPAGFGVEGTGTPSTMDFEVLRGMLGGAWQNLVSPLYLARDTAQSVRDMAPRGFYADLYEAGKRVAANPRAVPGMVQNALKQSAEYARSSPYAMGETIGGMLDVRNMLRRPNVISAIDRKFPNISPERAQAMREDLMGKALRGEMTWDEYQERSKPLLDIVIKDETRKRQLQSQRQPPAPVFEGLGAADIPRGTRVMYARYPQDTPQPVKVHSTYLVNTKNGAYRGLVLELENGKTVRALHSQIKEVFMPRAAQLPPND